MAPNFVCGTLYSYSVGGCRCDECKSTYSAYYKEYAKRNQEKITERYREWRKRNPDYDRTRYAENERVRHQKKEARNKRRARLRGTECCASAEGRILVYEQFGYRCAYCGDPAKQLDHMRPLARGGRDCLGNLVAACGSCNSRKWSKGFFEWCSSEGVDAGNLIRKTLRCKNE